jgi:2Fe-2S ferredoxin
MSRVTFLPSQVVVEAREGETVLEVALRGAVPIQHACGGFSACTACHVVVKSGSEHLSAMDEREEERLERARGLTLSSRLACQARVYGDVTILVMNP